MTGNVLTGSENMNTKVYLYLPVRDTCVINESVTSALCYHTRYQSRSSMFFRGLIPRKFAELAEAAPIGDR